MSRSDVDLIADNSDKCVYQGCLSSIPIVLPAPLAAFTNLVNTFIHSNIQGVVLFVQIISRSGAG